MRRTRLVVAAVLAALVVPVHVAAQPRAHGARVPSGGSAHADCMNKCEQTSESCTHSSCVGGASCNKCLQSRQHCMSTCPSDSGPSGGRSGDAPQQRGDRGEPDSSGQDLEGQEARADAAQRALLDEWRRHDAERLRDAEALAGADIGKFLLTLCKVIPPNFQPCTLGGTPFTPPPPPPKPGGGVRWSHPGLDSPTLSGDPWPPVVPKDSKGCYVEDTVDVNGDPVGPLSQKTWAARGRLGAWIDRVSRGAWTLTVKNDTDHDVMVGAFGAVAFNTVVAPHVPYTQALSGEYLAAKELDPQPPVSLTVRWWTYDAGRCQTDALSTLLVDPEELNGPAGGLDP